MNREELRVQIQAAADRLTDELVGYFGEMLQSVVKDVTVGVGEAKPLRKAAPPPVPKAAPRKAKAPKKVTPRKAPKKAAGKAAEKAPKSAAPQAAKKAAPRKAEKTAAPKKGSEKKPPKIAKAAKAARAAKKSGRRSIEELDQAAELVFDFLKEQGRELRIEEINKALGTSTRELMRPIKKLLGSKQIQKRGERRSTTYSAS